MPKLLAVWWWLHPDYMAIAAVVISLLTLGVATWIALRQTAITRRQGQIAEVQHQFWQEQAAKRPDLHVDKVSGGSSLIPGGVRTRRILAIVNRGTATAREVQWALFTPEVAGELPNVSILPGNVQTKTDIVHDEDGRRFGLVEGRCEGPIHAGHRVELADVWLDISDDLRAEHGLRVCEFVLHSSEGRFPVKDFGTTDLRLRFGNWEAG